MNYLLAIDQGTTGTTALAVGPSGRVLASSYCPLSASFPRDGWVEQDAEQIYDSVLSAGRQLITELGCEPAGLSITNQRETTVLWDRVTSRPVGPAIVWQDRRTAPICERLIQAGATELIRERTGLVIDPYFSATKIAWLLAADPCLADRARSGRVCFGTVDSWLIWKLTGGREHVIDATNASRTMLARIDPPAWDDDLLGLLDIPRQILPEIVPSSGWSAPTTESGLAPGSPIAGIAGDQHAALFGQACFVPGQVKTSYGTGCFCLLNTGPRPVQSGNRLLSTLAWQIGSETTYALEGSVFMGGAVVQWLRDEMGLIKSAAQSEEVASAVTDSGGVVLVPAFTGLGAPHWDPRARAAIFGMTRGSNAAHIVRAGLESIAFQVCDVIAAMSEDVQGGLTQMRVDGGAAANNLLMQMQADLAGLPVIRPAVVETTGLGSALLAGLTLGWWENLGQLEALWRADRQFDPTEPTDLAPRRARWRRALERSKNWV